MRAHIPPQTVGEDPSAPPGPGRRDWLAALRIAIGVRLALFGVAGAAAWLLSSSEGGAAEGVFDIWSRWDATLLLQISEHGYTPAGDPHATAFFPLLPLAVRVVHALGPSRLTAALLINTAASVVALAYLHRLADHELGEGSGKRAALLLALFPTGVFLIAPYTEALFLAGAIPAFWYARRGRWLHVALPAAVATGARLAGAFVLAGLAVEFVAQRRYTAARALRAGAALAAGALPLVAYMIFLARTRGDALYFLVDQKEGWGRAFVGPVRAFRATWDTWTSGTYPANWMLAWRIEIAAAAIGVALVGWALAKREWGYAAFTGALMATLLTSSWYFSIPRMLLSAFPLVLFLASWSRRKESRWDALLLTFGPLAALGAIVYTRGGWFF